MTHQALTDLIRISNTTGKDPALIQGGWGNTSVKTPDGRHMYIKVSGASLKDMTAQCGWRRLRIEPLLAILQDKALTQKNADAREAEVVSRLINCCDDDLADAGRPSIESHLHALLDRYVIHLHPTVVGAYVNAVAGRQKIEQLFKTDKNPPLWLPYADPGFQLARRLQQGVAQHRQHYRRLPTIIFLEKHGLIVSADTADGALKLVRQTISRCEKGLKPPAGAKLKTTAKNKSAGAKPKTTAAKIKLADATAVQNAKFAIRAAVFDASGRYTPVYHVINETIAAFMTRPDARKLLSRGPLAPGEVVYSNGPAVWLDRPDRSAITKLIQSRQAKGHGVPAAWLIKPLGLFIAAEPKKADNIREIIPDALWVRSQAVALGGVNPLTAGQQQFIRQGESQSLQLQPAKSASGGDLQNRIAVVTGSGSGLGRSIALGLARESAMVGLADIDVEAAGQTADLIRRELPNAAVEILPCNVTSEQSVNDAFERLIDNWGGLDILVNAAGVAPAYPLVDLPIEKWRFALEVNLTGYFLMAKVAARLMIRQGIGGSIINISSKTGLDASKNNTPYNATKAAELHMARGWAMELGPFGVRCNCVCPGNVFEGSKIWSPAYIRECARKYGIKPEEVIPYYINKTILKKEITGQDIADSVVFLCSDRARTITGQTLVADAGQVMVR